MRIIMFYHSLLSDWNHGNAHFLRGVAAELLARGHEVQIYEPVDSWSLKNLLCEHGRRPLQEFHRAYRTLNSIRYRLDKLNLDRVLLRADLVIVHEWNDHELVAQLGRLRAETGNFVLLFHDTHHRSVTDRASMSGYDLRHYDGVLAFGRAIQKIYLEERWSRRAFVWHEAADTRVFKPRRAKAMFGDLVWIGNWGDEERTAELHEFLLKPIRDLKLKARVYGVRYPEIAKQALAESGIEYAGWLPNFRVPEIFSRYRVTVHVPRRPYARALQGIPTIRPFEALACGIPLISAPWRDSERLFEPGRDFLVAKDAREMKAHLKRVLRDDKFARQLAERGREAVLRRHTCAHRVDELLSIYEQLKFAPPRNSECITKSRRLAI